MGDIFLKKACFLCCLATAILDCSCASKPKVPAQEELLSFARSVGQERRFLLRENEAQCEAPKYEVYVKGRWVRVFLDGPVSLLARIEEIFAADTEKVLKIEVRGQLKAKIMTTTTDVPYLLFEVEEICPCKEEVEL